METLLVASAIGADRPGLVHQLAHAVRDAGCSMQDSRMVVLGNQFCAHFLVRGNWSAVAKVEGALTRIAERLSLELSLRRTEARTDTSATIPYGVEVLSLDRPGVVEEVAEFFARRDINVEDLYTSTYLAPHTNAPMFSLHMTVGVPGDTAIAGLRNEFLELCDDLNLDAVLTAFK